jgi:anti-anti-sigma regulatory factor
MSSSTAANPFCLTLGPMLDIQRARGVYAMFDDALQGEDAIEVDVSGVERIDTTGFQMLIVFSLTLGRQNRQVCLVNPSDAFTGSAALLGFTGHLPAVVIRDPGFKTERDDANDSCGG